MAIISVSRLSYSGGEAIARQAATRLGYAYGDDDELTRDAADRCGIAAETLAEAYHKPPSLFGMSAATRKRCIACLQAALAARFLDDDIVHLGALGHLLVRGISHVMKVRIAAALPDRVARKVEREQCTPEEAERGIRHADKQRLALAQQIFGADDDDERLFDLWIDTSRIDTAEAVDRIVGAGQSGRYKAMTYSLACMRNVELGYRLRAALIDLDPDVDVEADEGKVRVRVHEAGRGTKKRLEEIEARAARIDGVGQLEVVTIRDALGRPGGGRP